jgi:lipopolysaccharide export system protein LptA
MIGKKIYLFILFIILFMACCVYAQENIISKADVINKNEPIEIVSDRLDAFNEKKLVVFSGNATAKQGNVTLKSDKLLLYYKKDPAKKDKVGTKEIEGTGDLDKIEANGNVSLTQGERIATGDEAIYFQDSGQVILIGNAVLREGKNVIGGDRVIVFLNDDRGIVESNTKKQVKAIIYPQEKKEEKK